ncbi:MAG: TIGR03936 family radical SAM-associated protein, partial [Defluviitaleaceae bacterium]|nr:TIGR03936 family radical SAM-associated protein [Defluviitaleaceae bacterium]
MHKIRLRFSKTDTLRFIGHLDFLRVVQQTIRRAALPVAFSQGFNPHILISFALPLPLGMASLNDYADLTLTDEIPFSEITERLNAAAPVGLTINAAYPAEDKAASVVCVADYVIENKTAGG